MLCIATVSFPSLTSVCCINKRRRSEYFRLLVRVFSGEFRNPANAHMKGFHAIVPPLTVNVLSIYASELILLLH